MLMRRVSAKDKISSGLLRGAVVSGVAAGMVAASLGGVPTSNATCLGIFGISINDGSGGHCSASLFGFALGLGPSTSATANEGFFNAAIAVGTNTIAIAGTGGLDFLNLAFNSGQATDGATSTVTAGGGGFNLAANVFGNANTGGGPGFSDLDVSAGNGFGNVALNAIGSNRNTIRAGDGSLDFAVNLGGSGGRGSDSRVSATGGLSAAFQSQTVLGSQCVNASNPGCGNVVTATGPLSLVAAAGVVGKEVVQIGPGITLANSFNEDQFPNQPLPGTALAASGTQRNVVRPSLNGTPGLNSTSNLSSTSPSGPVVKPINPLAASAKKFNDRLAASAKKFNDRLAASAKKFNDNVNATRAGAKPDTASTSDSNSNSNSNSDK
jgi:hypothetical protein